MPFNEYCVFCGNLCNNQDVREVISSKVRNAAYEIIERKGATYYAVGLGVARIVESIFRNEHSILTVSTILNGQYGLSNVALSLPAVVGTKGIERVLTLRLSEGEEEHMREAGNLLGDIIKGLDLEQNN